jgi:hypothetical protein
LDRTVQTYSETIEKSFSRTVQSLDKRPKLYHL